jgi:hypothetical protein
VLDPYSALESDLLRTAPQVINRLDWAFASELHRCVQRAVEKTAAPRKAQHIQADVSMAQSSTVELAKPQAAHVVHALAQAESKHGGELLIIEDNEESTSAAIIPGRQFRRLSKKKVPDFLTPFLAPFLAS